MSAGQVMENEAYEWHPVHRRERIDLKKHGAVLTDFWDGLISESRRKERAYRLKRFLPTS